MAVISLVSIVIVTTDFLYEFRRSNITAFATHTMGFSAFGNSQSPKHVIIFLEVIVFAIAMVT